MRATRTQARRPARPANGRLYLGLALLGWGLSILTGIVPHEDLLVGGGLAVFGAALVATAGGVPDLRLPAFATGAAGAVLIVAVLAYDALTRSPLNLQKATILAFGTLLLLAAPFLGRQVRLPLRGRPTTSVSGLVACALPVLGAPILVYATQALFESTLGSTPVEAFLRIGLLLPLAGFLRVLGWGPSLDGQTVTYATPNGPLVLEVGAACSGIQAMALFAGVLALFLIAERPGGRRLALWSAIGLGGVYVANLLRLATLAVVGYRWGGEALEQAHAQAGWMFFVAWALLFAWLVRRTGEPRDGKPTAFPAEP